MLPLHETAEFKALTAKFRDRSLICETARRLVHLGMSMPAGPHKDELQEIAEDLVAYMDAHFPKDPEINTDPL